MSHTFLVGAATSAHQVEGNKWQVGFGKTFGLIAVDRSTQKRTAKESLQVLGALAG